MKMITLSSQNGSLIAVNSLHIISLEPNTLAHNKAKTMVNVAGPDEIYNVRETIEEILKKIEA